MKKTRILIALVLCVLAVFTFAACKKGGAPAPATNTEAKATLNMTPMVGADGELFNSSRVGTRNIVITVKINGDVETNRLNLYRYFQTKEPVRVFYKNESHNVVIGGYVETVECDMFSNAEQAQISIICPDPYFEDYADPTEVTGLTGSDLNVTNNGNAECGFVLCYNVSSLPQSSTAGMIYEVKVTNTTNGKYMTISPNSVIGADPSNQYRSIYFDSVSKKIFGYLKTDQGETNPINLMAKVLIGSEFVTLDVGSNVLNASVVLNNLTRETVSYKVDYLPKYRGV